MIMSFKHTSKALLDGKKTVTRREWKRSYFDTWLNAWHKRRFVHKAYDKNPRNGGKQIGWIRLSKIPVMETYGDMPESDLSAEGGLWSSMEEFMGDTDPKTPCAVIRFKFFHMGTYINN